MPDATNSAVIENKIPSGYKEVSHGLPVTINCEQMPWLESPVNTTVAHFTLIDGTEFYLGSAVKGKRLVKAAQKLDEHRSRIADHLLYACLPEFVSSGYNPAVHTLINSVGDRHIYCALNPGGQRVYFMRMDELLGKKNEKPVIIKIAACDKTDQVDVLSVLTYKDRSFLKRRSKV